MEAFDYNMVQSTGLEPVTSSFAGRRSNPTELRLQIEHTHYIVFSEKSNFFKKCRAISWLSAFRKSQIP